MGSAFNVQPIYLQISSSLNSQFLDLIRIWERLTYVRDVEKLTAVSLWLNGTLGATGEMDQ